MIPAAVVLASLALSGTTTVAGRVTLGGLRPAGDDVWVTLGRGCPRTIPDDRIVSRPDGSLRDAVVTLIVAGETAAAPGASSLSGAAASAGTEVHALYCDLRPRVQVAPAGSLLTVREEPGSGHRLHAYRDGRSLWDGVLAPGKVRALVEPGVVDVRCDAGHEWEIAWVYVTDSPYFAVTGADGGFEVHDVPAGKYTLRAWHPYLGRLEAPIEVDPASPRGLVVSFSSRDVLEAMYPGNTVEVTR